MGDKKQNRINISFRDNEAETKLHDWVVKQGEVGGVSNYIKRILAEIMQKQEGK